MGSRNPWSMWETFKKPSRRLAGIALCLLGWIVAASWSRGQDQSIRLSLATNKASYDRGEQVELTLTVTNAGKEPAALSFRSAKQYDFIIKEDEKELWRWSQGRMFAQALTTLTLQARESKSFPVVWPQTSRDGSQIRPGSYEAVAILSLSGHPLSTSARLEIR